MLGDPKSTHFSLSASSYHPCVIQFLRLKPSSAVKLNRNQFKGCDQMMFILIWFDGVWGNCWEPIIMLQLTPHSGLSEGLSQNHHQNAQTRRGNAFLCQTISPSLRSRTHPLCCQHAASWRGRDASSSPLHLRSKVRTQYQIKSLLAESETSRKFLSNSTVQMLLSWGITISVECPCE